MSTDKGYKGAPFGIQIRRFATIGFHPGLDKTGHLQKKGGLGPGQYNILRRECWYKSHSLKETWTRKKECEDFSQMLGYRNARILLDRKEKAKACGPGTLEISPTLYKQQSNNVKENVGFGKEKRFLNLIKKQVPPPGTYGKNHDPYLRYEERRKPNLQWTDKPPFEWDGFINRFKINRFENKNALPSNLYKLPPVGIQQTLAKKCSKRGPYDCFTGPRDYSSIKNYFAPSINPPPKLILTLPNEIDKLLKAPKKRHYGKFFKCDRFVRVPGIRLMVKDLVMCPKNPEDPGPAHYDYVKPKTFEQNLYSFNQSVRNVRPVKGWELSPGVGRYNPRYGVCKQKEGRESFMFKSKAKREFYRIITYNNF